MSLRKDIEIKELYRIKHIHDKSEIKVTDLESEILNKSLSTHLFRNNILSSFIDKFKKMVFLFFDKFRVVHNFKNFSVHKYQQVNNN